MKYSVTSACVIFYFKECASLSLSLLSLTLANNVELYIIIYNYYDSFH